MANHPNLWYQTSRKYHAAKSAGSRVSVAGGQADGVEKDTDRGVDGVEAL